MRKKATLLQKIHESAVKFLYPLTPFETYRTIVEEAIDLIGGVDGLIVLQKKKRLHIAYASTPLAGQITVREKGFTYEATQHNKTFVLYREDFAPIHPHLAEQGVKAAAFIPLSYHEKAIGVVIVRSFSTKRISAEKLDTMRLFGSLASLAIRKTQLYSNTQQALDTRDLFIALASHELKTPLTTMTMYTHMFQKKIQQGIMPDISWANNLASETQRLTNLINDLLQLNQIERGELPYFFRTFHIRDIIKKAAKDFSLTHTHTLLVEDMLSDETDFVKGDKYKILQVLTNLLNNAAKFSPTSGTIYLSLGQEQKEYVVKIADRGEGIAKKDLPNIFEQFYKGKTHNKDGMGLGLFLTKTIIEKHGGSIDVMSQRGKGTTISITLPKNI